MVSRLLRAVALCATLCAAALSASAQEEPTGPRFVTRGFAVGPHLNLLIDRNREASNAYGGGLALRLGFGVTPSLAVFTDLGFQGGSNPDIVDENTDYYLVVFDARLLVRFALGGGRSRMSPYLVAGAAYRSYYEELYDWVYNETYDYSLDDFGPVVGVGMVAMVGRRFAIDIGVNGYYGLDFENIAVTPQLGMQVFLGRAR